MYACEKNTIEIPMKYERRWIFIILGVYIIDEEMLVDPNSSQTKNTQHVYL